MSISSGVLSTPSEIRLGFSSSPSGASSRLRCSQPTRSTSSLKTWKPSLWRQDSDCRGFSAASDGNAVAQGAPSRAPGMPFSTIEERSRVAARPGKLSPRAWEDAGLQSSTDAQESCTSSGSQDRWECRMTGNHCEPRDDIPEASQACETDTARSWTSRRVPQSYDQGSPNRFGKNGPRHRPRDAETDYGNVAEKNHDATRVQAKASSPSHETSKPSRAQRATAAWMPTLRPITRP